MVDQMTLSHPAVRRAAPLARFRRWEASGVLVALVVLCALLALATPNFFTLSNLPIVLRNASFVGLVALGQTLVLLIGGIDLSVGTAAGLSAVVGALMLTKLGLNPYVVFLLTALFGLCLGFFNAAFIAKLRLNPFIVTLASGEIFAGINLVITQGYPVRPLGPTFRSVGQGEFLGVPVLYASRMDAAQPSVGEGWMLSAITAAIIGGTSLRGGEGTVVGTVLGAVLLTVLQNGTVLLNVSGYWQRAIIGSVVLVAVLVDLFRRK